MKSMVSGTKWLWSPDLAWPGQWASALSIKGSNSISVASSEIYLLINKAYSVLDKYLLSLLVSQTCRTSQFLFH
jgi:hypothetical protein